MSTTSQSGTASRDLGYYAWLSIWAAVATILLKTVAWWLTGSVGLLSDAIESVVNLVGGVMALLMLRVAAQPADDEHPFGHSKAEYFSSGLEGALIVVAALSIGWAALPRLWSPLPLEEVGLGLAVSCVASLVNLVVALVVLRAGRRNGSITLEANGRHLLTDVWTSVGVVVAIGLVALTGWLWLDPVIALVVAANIIHTGIAILKRSIAGLMDKVIPSADRRVLEEILERHRGKQVDFHAVITRRAGMRKFVSMHVLVPGEWTVQQGHELVEEIEREIREAIQGSVVFTHLEPIEDPVSFKDERLERED